MMIKAAVASVALLTVTATAVDAQGIGPQIAYVKAGTYSEIYLVDPDGSRLRQLYRSPQRMRIFTLDMKPGGGELAFEEVPSNASTAATLKVIQYDQAGTRVAVRSLPVCRISSLDYHPSGSDLLYFDSCAGARRLNTATMTATTLPIPGGLNKIGWRNATELMYNRSTPSASEMLVAPLTAPTDVRVIGEVRLVQTMDLSTSGDLLLVDPVDYGNLSLFNMNTGTEQQAWQIGNYGTFSPDDNHVAYVSGYDVRGSYIFIRRTDGSGARTTLASKGPFQLVHWRN